MKFTLEIEEIDVVLSFRNVEMIEATRVRNGLGRGVHLKRTNLKLRIVFWGSVCRSECKMRCGGGGSGRGRGVVLHQVIMI